MSRLSAERWGGGTDLRYFARLHRLGHILLAGALVAVVAAVVGGYTLPLPTVSGGTSRGVPCRQELPLLTAVFLSAVLSSRMAEYEQVATARYFRVRALALCALTGVLGLLSFLLLALAASTEEATVFVRSLLLWLGLALLSARLWGNTLAWLLPLLSAFAPVWWNYGARWDWTRAAANDPLAWISAGLALAAGVLATATTKRRVNGLLRKAR